MFIKRLRLPSILLCTSVVLSISMEAAWQPLPVRADGPVTQLYLPLIVKVTFYVGTNRPLWESTVGGNVLTEDFEKDAADYGVLSFPYLTGNGFWLDGQSSAQILGDGTLLPSGNLLHFRDWGSGLTFRFPNDTQVRAFGFDYRAGEEWRLIFNNSDSITLPPSRPSFVGIVFSGDYPSQFTLWSDSGVQRGLTVDNISYTDLNR